MTAQDITPEMIEAGVKAYMDAPDDCDDVQLFGRIYIAMRSKDHSIAVDDVERVALAMAIEIGWGTFSHFNPEDMRRIARAALTAIGSQSNGHSA